MRREGYIIITITILYIISFFVVSAILFNFRKYLTYTIFRMIMLIIGVIVISTAYVYNYPFQKYRAMKRYYVCVELQGASLDKISNLKIKKNYKMGGYSILVNYEDDMSCTYRYNYHLNYNYNKRKFQDYMNSGVVCNNPTGKVYKSFVYNEDYEKEKFKFTE